MSVVAVLAPGRRRCGVADYARQLASAFDSEWSVEALPFPAAADRRSWRGLARRAGQADVVHVHFEHSLFPAIKPYRNLFGTVMRSLPAPRVVTLHGPLPRLERRSWRTMRDVARHLLYLPWFAGWEARLYGMAEAFVVHTEALLARSAALAGEERVRLLRHPVPECRRRWDRIPGTPTLVAPGFVKPHKGYGALLDVLAQRRSWRWCIAGAAQTESDARYERQLLSAIRERGLQERVRTTGYLERERMEEEISNATLAIFPFESATGSGSVAWAIGVGIPVVATDLPEMVELRDAGAGIALLPRRAVAEWTDRLTELVGDEPLLERLAARNRRFAAEHSFAGAAASMGRLFSEVIEKHPRSSR